MRKLSIIAAILFLAGTVSALGTFVEQSDMEGPEAVYNFGVVANQELEVEILAEEKPGLEYNYTQVNMFDPENPDSNYMYQGDYLSINYFEFHVTSEDPERSVYEIPVILRVYDPESGDNGATSKVIQEREYVIAYGTDFEREYGFDGELIPDEEEEQESDEESQQEQNQEVLSTTEDNSTSTGGEGSEEEQSIGTTTYVLAMLVLITLLYTTREALK